MQIEALNIEELVDLRDKVNSLLTDRVAARQSELQRESELLATLTGKTSPKRPVKYRDGPNEWTGVGTTPGWLAAKKALGEDLKSIACDSGTAERRSLAFAPHVSE